MTNSVYDIWVKCIYQFAVFNVKSSLFFCLIYKWCYDCGLKIEIRKKLRELKAKSPRPKFDHELQQRRRHLAPRRRDSVLAAATASCDYFTNFRQLGLCRPVGRIGLCAVTYVNLCCYFTFMEFYIQNIFKISHKSNDYVICDEQNPQKVYCKLE